MSDSSDNELFEADSVQIDEICQECKDIDEIEVKLESVHYTDGRGREHYETTRCPRCNDESEPEPCDIDETDSDY